MQYMLLIYGSDSKAPQQGTAEFDTFIGDFFKYTDELKQSGAIVHCDGLQATDTAKTVSVRNDKVTLLDGPFAETKEQLGGFYLIEVENLDQAIKWAVKIPTATYGRVEIRPIMVFN